MAVDALPATFFEALERIFLRAVEIEVEAEVRVIRVLIVNPRTVDRQPRAEATIIVEAPELRVLVRTRREARG